MDEYLLKEGAVDQFMAVTNTDRETATQLLEAHSFDLQGAIDFFF